MDVLHNAAQSSSEPVIAHLSNASTEDFKMAQAGRGSVYSGRVFYQEQTLRVLGKHGRSAAREAYHAAVLQELLQEPPGWDWA